jgi:hypothetical protein
VWDETAAVIEVIWVGAEQQNFLLWDSTAPTTPNLARRAVDFLKTTAFGIAAVATPHTCLCSKFSPQWLFAGFCRERSRWHRSASSLCACHLIGGRLYQPKGLSRNFD